MVDRLWNYRGKEKAPELSFRGFIFGGSGEIGFTETSFSNSRPTVLTQRAGVA